MAQSDDTMPTAERFIATAIQLIEEHGGSTDVNLREISRRMGCAHTNLYNYFPSYRHLLWEAFRCGLDIYGEHLVAGLSVELPSTEYLHRAISNLVTFPELRPGLYRFIGSDPLDTEAIPEDILEYVTGMKEWLAAAFAAAGPALDEGQARRAADIVLAYIDGETLNLINGREIPSENLRDRIVGNARYLFELLADGGGSGSSEPATPPDPRLIFARRQGRKEYR